MSIIYNDYFSYRIVNWIYSELTKNCESSSTFCTEIEFVRCVIWIWIHVNWMLTPRCHVGPFLKQMFMDIKST